MGYKQAIGPSHTPGRGLYNSRVSGVILEFCLAHLPSELALQALQIPRIRPGKDAPP